jgi:tripartite-type tricarboxylate transporter receptor subunit TctC
MRSRFARRIALLTLIGAAPALAQDYPAKPIKIVVPYQAGGGLDMMCRTIAEKLSEYLKQPFIVDNRVGGAGTIGAANVAHSAPDGYTILCGNNSEITLAQYVIAKLPYEPERDFAPIAMAVKQTVLLVANPSVPAHDMKQLIELTRRQPQTYATSGIGSNLHLAMEMLSAEAKAPFIHVPYKGAAGLVSDNVAGHVSLAVINLAPLVQHIQERKLRPLLVFQSERNPAIPDVPTAKEAAGVDVLAASWFGFLAPAQTPRAIVAKLEREILRALAESAVKAKLGQVYMDVAALPAAEFAEIIRKERAENGALVRRFNIKAD